MTGNAAHGSASRHVGVVRKYGAFVTVTDPQALESFLAEPRNVVVIGLRPDGRIHATPNWFLWEGGHFYVSTTKDRAKYRVFRNDPRVQLVFDDSTGFRYVVVDGTVDIAEDIDAGLGFFQRLREKHGRGGQRREDLREEMIRDRRVLLVITPTLSAQEWLATGI